MEKLIKEFLGIDKPPEEPRLTQRSAKASAQFQKVLKQRDHVADRVLQLEDQLASAKAKLNDLTLEYEAAKAEFDEVQRKLPDQQTKADKEGVAESNLAYLVQHAGEIVGKDKDVFSQLL